MAYLVVFLLLGIICCSVFMAVIGKSKKTKRIAWGLVIMLAVAPLVSWCIAIPYGTHEGDGFAAVGMMMLLFPIIFVIGLVLMLVGIFKKE